MIYVLYSNFHLSRFFKENITLTRTGILELRKNPEQCLTRRKGLEALDDQEGHGKPALASDPEGVGIPNPLVSLKRISSCSRITVLQFLHASRTRRKRLLFASRMARNVVGQVTGTKARRQAETTTSSRNPPRSVMMEISTLVCPLENIANGKNSETRKLESPWNKLPNPPLGRGP